MSAQFSDLVDIVIRAQLVPRSALLPEAMMELGKCQAELRIAIGRNDDAGAVLAAAKIAAATRIVGRILINAAPAPAVAALAVKIDPWKKGVR